MITFRRAMSRIFLTPASISYLTQFILALAITLFLLNRLRSQRVPSLFLLTAFFASMTVLTGLLVFNASLLPFHRLLTAYAENAVLALALVALVWFAYHFPERYPQHKWEMRILLALSLVYFFWEAGFMIYRYVSLLGQGNVFNRFPLAAYSLPVVMLFAPFAFLRQTLAADLRPIPWWRRLWKPEGKDAQGARNFALVFGIPFVLGIISVILSFGLPFTLVHAAVSIGILLMLWLFANNYVNFIPGSVDLASRLSILMLTLFLALIGTLGWLIAPSYIATFRPDLKDYQTLRFTPNAEGGYDVREADFHFESALGGKVDAQTLDENGNRRVDFTFPFYGETYTEVYVTYSGIVSLGGTFRPLNLEAAVARVPNIFPLRVKLIPNPAEEDSGLYIRREPERLIVTWNRMLSSQAETLYTFQSILYADGTFEFTYNGLPQPILFSSDASPPANPWLRGAVAGRGEPLHELPAGVEEPANLVALSRAGASPLLENHLLAFRRYLHAFMLPVAWVVVGGSLLILLVVPLLLRSSIARPLETLTAGVRRMGSGEMHITIPVRSEDEIGFLTGAFNAMSGALDDLVHNLEVRVADRTRELDGANASLRAEMSQRESAQRQLLQQQRALAAFEERERLARDLHDSVNQSIQSVNLFSETLAFLLKDGRYREALEVTERIQQGGQRALREIRLLLYESQAAQVNAEMDLPAALEERLDMVERRVGVKARIIQQDDDALSRCPAAWRENLYWIAVEALNNALKYSQARHVTITISRADADLELTIEDDGAGFDPARTRPGGFGMRSMRERASLLGGILSITSSPEQGTRVHFKASMEELK